MAKTLVVVLTCDRCSAEGVKDSEGRESVSLGYDGYSYNLDLCAPHAEEFHNSVQAMISWSSERSRLGSPRRTRRSTAADGPTESSAPRSGSDRERLKAIREWGRKHGHPDLSDRGRIPQAIVSEYEAAHKS